MSVRKLKECENKRILLIETALLILLSIFLSFYLGIILSVCVSFILGLVFFLFFRKRKIVFQNNKPILINSAFLSVALGRVSLLLWDSQIGQNKTMVRFFLFLVSSFVLYIPNYVIFDAIYARNVKRREKGKYYLFLSLSAIILYFILFIDFPLELFLNNTTEFSFILKDELIALLGTFHYLFLFVFLVSLMPPKVVEFFGALLSALIIGCYCQYMFFNRHLGQIIGETYNWKKDIPFAVITLFFWVILILGTVAAKCVFRNDQINKYLFLASLIVFVLLSVSLVATAMMAPSKTYRYETIYASGEEQFDIGKKDNIIVFVIDAVDNNTIGDILKSDYLFFSEYQDFTLYTDTCSVYDLTSHSIPQMLFGYTKLGTENRKADAFLERLRNNGYRVLLFDDKVPLYGGIEKDYADNFQSISTENGMISVDYKKIRKDMLRLSLFQGLPCMLKKCAAIETVDFKGYVFYEKRNNIILETNNAFENSLALKIGDKSENYFIYYHIEGVHFPCENMEKETKHCLNIFKRYMEQMKELGVYNNATIIVCSDHGRHDDDGDIPFPTAATPMFMVKKAGEKHDKMVISGAPMYYMDFQSTMLVAAGLFQPETDYDLFGKSVYDYKEGDVRTRTWFDTDFHKEGIVKVTYTGDTAEFERVVNAGEYEKVDSWAFRYSE